MTEFYFDDCELIGDRVPAKYVPKAVMGAYYMGEFNEGFNVEFVRSYLTDVGPLWKVRTRGANMIVDSEGEPACGGQQVSAICYFDEYLGLPPSRKNLFTLEGEIVFPSSTGIQNMITDDEDELFAENELRRYVDRTGNELPNLDSFALREQITSKELKMFQNLYWRLKDHGWFACAQELYLATQDLAGKEELPIMLAYLDNALDDGTFEGEPMNLSDALEYIPWEETPYTCSLERYNPELDDLLYFVRKDGEEIARFVREPRPTRLAGYVVFDIHDDNRLYVPGAGTSYEANGIIIDELQKISTDDFVKIAMIVNETAETFGQRVALYQEFYLAQERGEDVTGIIDNIREHPEWFEVKR